MEINISNKSHMADFNTTKGNITLSGNYRFDPETSTLSDLNFNGNVGGESYFNGNIDKNGNVNCYGFKLTEMTAIASALSELHAGIVEMIAD